MSVYLWAPAGKRVTSWLSFVMSYCEVVTFSLVSWVRCGTWLYWFLIFAPLLINLKRVWHSSLCCRHCWKLGVHTRVVPVSHRLFLLHGTRILSVFPSMKLLQVSSIICRSLYQSAPCSTVTSMTRLKTLLILAGRWPWPSYSPEALTPHRMAQM